MISIQIIHVFYLARNTCIVLYFIHGEDPPCIPHPSAAQYVPRRQTVGITAGGGQYVPATTDKKHALLLVRISGPASTRSARQHGVILARISIRRRRGVRRRAVRAGAASAAVGLRHAQRVGAVRAGGAGDGRDGAARAEVAGLARQHVVILVRKKRLPRLDGHHTMWSSWYERRSLPRLDEHHTVRQSWYERRGLPRLDGNHTMRQSWYEKKARADLARQHAVVAHADGLHAARERRRARADVARGAHAAHGGARAAAHGGERAVGAGACGRE